MRLLALLLAALLCSPVGATSFYYGSPYGYRSAGFHHYAYPGYGYRYPRYGYFYDPYFNSELSRTRDQLRVERLHQLNQAEQFNQQMTQLRSQVDYGHQVSAEQACYYRTTGGFEACEDMFDADSDQRQQCEESVRLRNPGCN